MARCRFHASILALLIALGTGCAEPPKQPPSWAVQRADGQLQRALSAEAEGDLPRARELAGLALDESREAAHVVGTARALALLGRLTGDHLQLLDAIGRLEALDEDETLIRARLDLAELALAGGRFRMAADQTEAALARLEEAGLDRQADARLAARAWHASAAALRLAGVGEAARSHERRASLMLSLIDEAEMPELRLEVSQRLGDDHAAASDFRLAFQQHSRASFLAREHADRPAEMLAIASMSRDLEAMDRVRDAVDHCERALDIALELDERAQAAALARRALQLLMVLGESPGSERWLHLSAVLEHD